MKICPKCHHEFEDNVKFCKECGTPLVDQLTCPNCGELITPNDTFCGNCGQQLQEKKEKEIVNKDKKPLDAKKTIKNMSIFVLLAFMILSFISFIGIFGEVLYRFDNTSGSGTSSLGLDFYKSMYSDASTAYKYDYRLFASTLSNITTIQLMFFFLAIIGVLFGFVFSLINLIFVIKKDISIKDKLLYIFPLTIAMHPIMLSFTYCGKAVIEGTTYQTITRLGWGSGMIFVSAIIALCILLLYASIKRNFLQEEKDGKLNNGYVIFEIIHLFICVTLVIVLFVSSSHIIRLDYTISSGGNSLTVKGYGATMSDYLSLLLQAEQNDTSLPSGAPLIAIGHSVLIFAFIMSLPFILVMDNKKLKLSVIFGIISLTLLITGFTLSYSGESAYIDEMASSSSMPAGAVKYSILAIVVFVLIPVSIFINLLKQAKLEEMKSAA